MSKSSVPGMQGLSKSKTPAQSDPNGSSGIIPLSEIPAWSSVPYASQETWADDGSSNSKKKRKDVRFPFSEAVNAKVRLWTGDISRLGAIDAIVCPTNEAMNDRSGIAKRIYRAAGSKLSLECSRLSEGCHTGEAVATASACLASQGVSKVIHTVGPKYNVKYDTAAENALHGCYRSCLRVLKECKLSTVAFPCVYEARKEYPRDKAAHIAIRTVRRFLENYGEGVDAVVFCIPESADEDLRLYKAMMPLYFPRDDAEALAAEAKLPDDTGNEIGEKIIDDRKIKIMDFNKSVFEDLAEGDDTTRAKGRRLHLPEDDDDLSEKFSRSSMSDTAAAFGTMETDDFDRMRVAKISMGRSMSSTGPEDGSADPASRRERMYDRYRRRALDEDFTDLDDRKVMYDCGQDAQGRTIMVFVAENLPFKRIAEERVLMYVIRKCDRIASKPFVVVYVHTKMSYSNRPDRSWLRRAAQEVLHKKYSKNLKRMYVVHPSFWVKTVFWFLTPFVSKKFWAKMIYIDRIDELYVHFDPTKLALPESTYARDLKKGPVRSRGSSEVKAL